MVLSKSRYRITTKNIFVFMLLFPHFRPESLAYIAPLINTAYNVGRVLSFLMVMGLLMYKRKKPSSITAVILAAQLWVVFTTYINKGDVQRAFITMLSTISLLLIVDIYAKENIINPLLFNL